MKIIYEPTTGKIYSQGENPEMIAGYSVQELPNDVDLTTFDFVGGIYVENPDKVKAKTNLGFKMEARRDIKYQVEDLPDQLATVAKKLNMITRAMARIFNQQLNGVVIPEVLLNGYKSFFAEYCAGVDAVDEFGNAMIYDRADLENDVEMFAEIVAAEKKIADIIKIYKSKIIQ